MSNKHRHGAPEAPKASSVPVNPTELVGTPAVVENASAPSSAPTVTDGAPEAPKPPGVVGSELDPSSATGDTLGAISKLVRTEEPPRCSKCTNERPCSVECFVAAGYKAEHYEARFGAPHEAPATGIALQGVRLPSDGMERTILIGDPRRKRPLPDGAVIVRALVGVVARVEHRHPGERFWLLKSRPEDDTNPLGEYADEFVARGEVEIL